MTIEVFKASTQYDDWTGTVAADRSDNTSLEDWLSTNGIEAAGKLLVGISVFAGENPGRHVDPLYMELLLIEPGAYEDISAAIETGTIEVERRIVDIDLSVFFGLFKRFSIKLSNHGVLTDQGYTYFD